MKALSARNSPIPAKIGGPLKLLSLSDKLPDPPRQSFFTILSLLFRTTFFHQQHNQQSLQPSSDYREHRSNGITHALDSFSSSIHHNRVIIIQNTTAKEFSASHYQIKFTDYSRQHSETTLYRNSRFKAMDYRTKLKTSQFVKQFFQNPCCG